MDVETSLAGLVLPIQVQPQTLAPIHESERNPWHNRTTGCKCSAWHNATCQVKTLGTYLHLQDDLSK